MFNIFKAKEDREIIINSPLQGEVIPIEEVEDPVFASKILGVGLAIKPTLGKVLSPIKGSVEIIFPTKHAICIKLASGIEVLIHIGINTVELNGKHFISYVENGDKVDVGDLLIEFNIERIEELGYSMTTPIIITNSMNFTKTKYLTKSKVDFGEELFKIMK